MKHGKAKCYILHVVMSSTNFLKLTAVTTWWQAAGDARVTVSSIRAVGRNKLNCTSCRSLQATANTNHVKKFWCEIMLPRETNLMSLAVLFHYLMLNMFRMLIHPSSGACDLFVDLFHGLYCSGSMCVGVTLWFGCCGVVSVCRLKH